MLCSRMPIQEACIQRAERTLTLRRVEHEYSTPLGGLILGLDKASSAHRNS